VESEVESPNMGDGLVIGLFGENCDVDCRWLVYVLEI
jgi:hypothetical protein